jgi:hypothetical protein
MHSNLVSIITLVCAVAYQVIFSIAPSFADQPKTPPRCYMKYYNCISAYNYKNNEIPSQCRNQYNDCLKGVAIR